MIKETHKCFHCDEMVKQHYKSETKFCSYKCQRSYERKIAVESGTASSKTMKAYLLEHHGNKCMDADCRWDFSRFVAVELEHKDGNSSNNSLENCILLCPNCHSLTATYKAKNKGNGRFNRRQRFLAGQSY